MQLATSPVILALLGFFLTAAKAQPVGSADPLPSALHIELTKLTLDLDRKSTTFDFRITNISQPFKLEEVSLAIALISTTFYDSEGRVWTMEPLGFLPIVQKHSYSLPVSTGTNTLQVVEARLVVLKGSKRSASRERPKRLSYVIFEEIEEK
jgi:hypothetical protein